MEEVPLIPGPWWMFDAVTLVFLLAAAIGCVVLWVRWREQRRMAPLLGLVCLALAWGVVFWGSAIEPHLLRVQETALTVGDGEGVQVRLAVIADTHVGPYKGRRWMERVVDVLNRQQVDAVLIAGDFIYHKTEEVRMLESLANMQVPVFAVLGNHDQEFGDAQVIAETLQSYGVRVLRNGSATMHKDEGDWTIVGLDDIWFTANPVEAFGDLKGPIALLVHNPDVILDPYGEKADVIIAGHTHCGQIRLPWVGPIAPIPTVLGQAWDCGVFPLGGGRQLFITAGVGESGPRARLFNPPTIDVIDLTLPAYANAERF